MLSSYTPLMSSAYKPLWGLFAILLGVSAVVAASKWMQPNERIPWRTDLPAATAEARQAGKPLLLYFTATWCGPCQQMRRTTWSDAGVERALQAYVPVKVDIDQRADLAAQYRVQAVPSMIIQPAAADAAPTKSIEGAMPPDAFIRWLKGSG